MSQPQHMNMQGMPNMGGPVQMNAGTPNSNATPEMSPLLIQKKLNTAIYDYMLRHELYEAAKSFSEKMPIEVKTETKDSPDQRNGQMNGMDDGMDDSKDPGIAKRPAGLPMPFTLSDGPFLQDWWNQFWEIWHGHRGKGKNGTQMYIGAQRQAQKGRFNMMGGDPATRYMQMNNGMAMNQNDLKRAAMQQNQARNNMTQAQMQQQLKMNAAQQQNPQMMQGNQMERQGSQMDMGGPRSGSPSGGDAPSPKRQRLEGGGMQQMNQGRPGVPGQMQGSQVGLLPELPQSDPARLQQTRAVLQENAILPEDISEFALQNLSTQSTDVQKKTVEVYSHSIQQQMQAAMNNLNSTKSNVNKGMNPNAGPGGAQGSPMSQAGMDGAAVDFYAANGGRMQMPQNGAAAGQPGNGNNGNHALQDYQMQLMLLEQQNKKRLLMARQEQDSLGGHPPGVGPNGQFAPGRASPTPGMMDPNQVPPNMRAQMMANANGQMMRPPSSHPMPNLSQNQMDIMRQQGVSIQGQMMPGQPPQGQMMPGGPVQGQQPMGTPRQPNNMPPPPAPQTTGAQPSSPSQPAAPPTPSTAAKPKPGTKKEAAKKGANKKGAAAATPATESEQPPTPTPATPATPMNANSFAQKQNQQLPNGQPPNAQANAQAAAAQQNAQQQQQNAANVQAAPLDMNAPFGSLDNNEFSGMDLGFTMGDELENFDFDSFLNADGGDPLGFDANFAFDGIETSLDGN